jgi:hypothetical protein
MPCTQPQPQSSLNPSPPASLHQPITAQVNDTTHQPNQPTAPYKAQGPTRPCTRRAQQTTRTHPFARGEEKRKLAYRSLRYGQGQAMLGTGSRHATLRCAPADPAVTRTRRGDVAGWPCLAAALCVPECEGEYGAGCGYTFRGVRVPRVCERVKGGGECLVTKAGRTFVRRGNTITGWGFAELGGMCATHWVCV